MADSKKVLVVDDEENILDLFNEVLTKQGHGVKTAKNGWEAIDKTKQEKFDYIFLDIKMSGLNGIETFKKIRELDTQVKVIIMTAYRTMAEELITEPVKKQIYAILYKPFSMKKIVEIIK